MNFFHRERRTWRIERERPGRYLNSPMRWEACGILAARTARRAQTRAEEVVGAGNVRVRLASGREQA